MNASRSIPPFMYATRFIHYQKLQSKLVPFPPWLPLEHTSFNSPALVSFKWAMEIELFELLQFNWSIVSLPIKCISYTGWLCLHLRECFLLTDSETVRKKFKWPKNITEIRKDKAAKERKETQSLHTLRTQFLEIPPGHGPWQHLAEPYVAVNILSLNLRHNFI